MAENALFWRIFVGTAKKRENRACYMSITVVIVAYKVCEAHLQHPSTTTPPDSRLKERPYPHEKFFIFFSKNEVMVSIEKNQTFSFYIFFFL